MLTICMDFYLNIRNSSYKQRKHLKGDTSYFSYTKLFVSVFCSSFSVLKLSLFYFLKCNQAS